MENIEIIKTICYCILILSQITFGIIWSSQNLLVKFSLLISAVLMTVILIKVSINTPNWELEGFPVIISALPCLVIFLYNNTPYYIFLKILGFINLVAVITFFSL